MKKGIARGVAWVLTLVLFLTGIGIEHLQVFAQSKQQFDTNNAIYDFSSESNLHKGMDASVANNKLVMNIKSSWGAARARLPFEFVAGTDYSISFDVNVEKTSLPKVWVILASDSDTNAGVDNGTESKRLSTLLNAGTQIETDKGYKYTFDFTSNTTTDGLIGQGYKYFGIFVQSGTVGEVYIDNVNACVKGTTIYDFSDDSELQKGVSATINDEKLTMNIGNSWGAARARLPYEFIAETDYSISFDVSVEKTSLPKVWVVLASNSDTNAGVDNGTESKRLSTLLNAGTQIETDKGYKYTFDFTSNTTTDDLIGQGYKYFGIFVQSGTVGEVYIDNVAIKKNGSAQEEPGNNENLEWPVVFEKFGDSKYVVRKGNAALNHDTSDGNLNVTTTQGWVMTYLLLPFQPENDATYEVNIEYKGLMNDVKAGVYKTNADVNDFYNSNKKTSSINFENKSSFGTKQIQVQIGSDWVNANNKFLGFEFKSNSTNAYSIKKITISKVESTVSFVTGLDDLEVAPMKGAVGETIELPEPVHADYAFEGWYLEPEFINKCTEFTFAQEEQTLYAKWTEIVETIYEFANATECKVYSGTISDGVLVLTNSNATTKDYKQTSVVFPYVLKNDCTYRVEIKYKTDLSNYNLKIGNFQNTSGWEMIQGRTDFASLSNKTSDEYKVQTFTIATNDKITASNNRLGIFVQVGGTEEVVIDQVKITKLGGKVSFVTNVDGIQVESMYGAIGESVELPQPDSTDFALEGWYLDPELTNRCDELKFIKGEQVLYAKWVEKTETIFDFSNASKYKVFNGSVLDGVLHLSNSEGTIKDYKQTSVVLPYELQNDCGYQIEIKYKTNLANYNLKVGNFKDISSWDMIQNRTDFVVVADKSSSNFTVQTLKFVTNNEITSTNKLLGILVQVGGADEFLIDQIKVTKLGCKVSFVTNIDGYEVQKEYGVNGTKVSLPKVKHPDLALEGWYFDSELTNRCTELSFTKEEQVLYAKWVENPVTVFDFSNANDYTVFSGVVSDGVAKLSNSSATAKDYKQTSILFPYELENGCGYRVEIKYKTNMEKFDMQVSNFKKTSSWDMIQDRTEFAGVTNEPSSSYKVSTCTFSTTNQITKNNKYFGILVRVGGTGAFYIDEVKITKLNAKIRFETSTTESTLEPVYGTKGDTISLPKPPRRKTYIFQGWYYDSQLTQPVGDKYSFNSSDIDIVLYAKWVYGTTNVFDFSDPSEYKVYNGNIENGVLKLSNKEGRKSDYKQTSVVFPYTLENNKTYQVTIKYKTNLSNYSLVVGNFKDLYTWDMVQGRTNYYKVDNAKSEKWKEETFIFSTKNEIKELNKFFGILVSIGGTDPFYIDEVSIKCFDVVVNFEGYYENNKIQFDPMGGIKGETITLHTEGVKPFVVQGWYYDKELTKPVGKSLTLGNKDVTLYGKIEIQKEVLFDFEEEDSIGVTGSQFIERIVDPKDNKNHIVRARWDEESYKSNYATLDYMLMPNRQYKISMKYRIDKPAIIQFLVKSGNGETIWNAAGEGLGTNLLTAMIFGKIQNKEWETVELTFTTDMCVDDVYKYVFLHLREPGTGANFDFDDIVIEDMGEFKASDYVTQIDSYEWDAVIDDSEKYGFGKQFLANNLKQLWTKFMSNKLAVTTAGISTVLLCAMVITICVKAKRKKKSI